MEEGRIYSTNDNWHAADIYDLNNADQLDWRCVGCDASVFPVAWDGLRKYKKSAHFKIHPRTRHENLCGIEQVETLLETGRSREIKSTDGFPDHLPSIVSFRSLTTIVPVEGEASKGGKLKSIAPTAPAGSLPSRASHRCQTQGIRRICEIYHGFPHLRGEPLRVPGCTGETYREIFKRLGNTEGPFRIQNKIHVVGVRYRSKMDYAQPELRIELNAGLKTEDETRRYQVVVDWREWSERARTLFKNFLEEKLNILQEQYQAAVKQKAPLPSVDMYFLGEQCAEDFLTFRVDHPQKIHLIPRL